MPLIISFFHLNHLSGYIRWPSAKVNSNRGVLPAECQESGKNRGNEISLLLASLLVYYTNTCCHKGQTDRRTNGLNTGFIEILCSNSKQEFLVGSLDREIIEQQQQRRPRKNYVVIFVKGEKVWCACLLAGVELCVCARGFFFLFQDVGSKQDSLNKIR